MKEGDWKGFWDRKSAAGVSDFELDRGTSMGDAEVESLSTAEMLAFIQPRCGEVVLDAGCGTGVNILLLHSHVGRIIGVDYAEGAIRRCSKRVRDHELRNVRLAQATVTQMPLRESSFDRILCLSVLHYLTDADVVLLLKEFRRLLKDDGELVLHVKNLSSLYLTTLSFAKKAKALLGSEVKHEHFRRFGWYIAILQEAGFRVVDFNSLNVAMLEGMPPRLWNLLRRLELRHQQSVLVKRTPIRRLGSELKIKAVLNHPARSRH